MSLKCSLLGHSFDETAVERDRQEDGSEVVITITELETCTRCGETRVVSENKEVTTMETPDDTGAGDAHAVTGDADTVTTGSGTDATDDTDPASVVDDADASGAVVDDAPVGDDALEAEAADSADDAEDDEGDDAEILGGGGNDPNDAQARARTDSTPIPDAESDDVPVGDPDEATDDAVIIDGDAADEHDPGEWPDESDADAATGDAETGGATGGEQSEVTEAVEGDDAAVWTGDDGASESDDAADADWPEEDESSTEPVLGEWPEEATRDVPEEAEADPTLERSASPTITVPEGMYKCTECGFTTEVESSSLRAGDFCPECRTGTLVQDDAAE